MTIHHVCAWCNKGMGKDKEKGRPSKKGNESHGICKRCMKKHFPQDVEAVYGGRNEQDQS